MNYNMDEMTLFSGEVHTLNVRQRVTYGMSVNSYCLIRIPTYWTVREETVVTTSITGGNLTYITQWPVNLKDGSDQDLYLTYHADVDIWPQWTNDF